ncbi:Transcriptional regulator AlcR in siderophore [Alcaligin] cluster [plant metagenome]|uniref:Transcriptional regulator AlcR in siderophore [Alcaligin] cluster n=1 Tax=plant metagenome TaxID=1297885 RepID=A0A484P3U5_9ZZZZ
MQLLASALACSSQGFESVPALSPRDRQLLERVRERRYEAPGEHHTLAELAKLPA